MNLYTIGFTKKSARQFFELIKKSQISILLDIRLNNKSQLAGFTKECDLQYFLLEICKCEYKHCIEYAPTKDILDKYKKKTISWDEYIDMYTELMNERDRYRNFISEYSRYDNVCFLCSESSATHCHRRLISEMIAQVNPQVNIKHI